jgi:hypothetical protein
MSNPWGRLGAPMVQPRKDDLWQWLREAQTDAADQRRARKAAEAKLEIAIRKLGELTLELGIRENQSSDPIEAAVETLAQKPSWRRFRTVQGRLSWRPLSSAAPAKRAR